MTYQQYIKHLMLLARQQPLGEIGAGVLKAESDLTAARKEIERLNELIWLLVEKVPEEKLTDKQVKIILDWIGIDTSEQMLKIKQALKEKSNG